MFLRIITEKNKNKIYVSDDRFGFRLGKVMREALSFEADFGMGSRQKSEYNLMNPFDVIKNSRN